MTISKESHEALGHLRSVTGRMDLTERVLKEMKMLDALSEAQAKQVAALKDMLYLKDVRIGLLEKEIASLKTTFWGRAKDWWNKNRRTSHMG